MTGIRSRNQGPAIARSFAACLGFLGKGKTFTFFHVERSRHAGLRNTHEFVDRSKQRPRKLCGGMIRGRRQQEHAVWTELQRCDLVLVPA